MQWDCLFENICHNFSLKVVFLFQSSSHCSWRIITKVFKHTQIIKTLHQENFIKKKKGGIQWKIWHFNPPPPLADLTLSRFGNFCLKGGGGLTFRIGAFSKSNKLICLKTDVKTMRMSSSEFLLFTKCSIHPVALIVDVDYHWNILKYIIINLYNKALSSNIYFYIYIYRSGAYWRGAVPLCPPPRHAPP